MRDFSHDPSLPVTASAPVPLPFAALHSRPMAVTPPFLLLAHSTAPAHRSASPADRRRPVVVAASLLCVSCCSRVRSSSSSPPRSLLRSLPLSSRHSRPRPCRCACSDPACARRALQSVSALLPCSSLSVVAALPLRSLFRLVCMLTWLCIVLVLEPKAIHFPSNLKFQVNKRCPALQPSWYDTAHPACVCQRRCMSVHPS